MAIWDEMSSRQPLRSAPHADVDAVRLDIGDPRPGRPPAPVRALVVEANPAVRLRLRNELTAAGYAVSTCPGPTAGVTCPALLGEEGRCPRVASDTSLLLLDDDVARTPVRDSYERWLPGAGIRVTRLPAVTPA